jgi:tetratricopeptide (TPR) repeat protein
MNSENSHEEYETTLTFTEKVDILFNEIDLAIKWSRPSILFAIYSSGTVLSKAKAELEERLSHLNQKIHIIEISGKKQSNFSSDIFKVPRLSHSVLFIDDINCNRFEENIGFFNELKRNLEKFIDNRIRVVFWLAEEEVAHFATNAVECWILRHHVVEFQDDVYQTTALLQTLESTWQELDEKDIVDAASSTAIKEIIDSPEKVEANQFHGNLILMLGILHWRKGNSKEALKFINVAQDIAKKISDVSLNGQCQDALSLIQAGAQNKDDPVKESEETIPLESQQSGNIADSIQGKKTSDVMEPSHEGMDGKEANLELKERGSDMKESDQIYDYKTSAEWNEMGNKFLRTGSYNDAINAFIKAIELAPDLSWPYIKNLASAHYHKGKVKGKLSNGKTEQPAVWEDEDDDMEPIAYFDQDYIPEAKRGDDPIGEKDDQLLKVTPTPEKNIVPAVNLDNSVADNPAVPQPSDHMSQPEIHSTTGDSSETKLAEQSSAVNDGNSVEVPSGFKPIPKIEENGPQCAFDWNTLGNSYASTQDYDKAINAYKRSIEMDPNFGQPYSNIGSVLFRIGKYESAEVFLKKSLDYLMTPEEKALSWNRLGDVYRRLRDYGNAMAAYQKAGQLEPDTNPMPTRARLSLMDSVAVG